MIPHRAELMVLREERKLTRAEIAAHYEVSIASVRRWIKDLKIPRPKRRSPTRGKNDDEDYNDGFTVFEQARIILGVRVIERRGYGYYLDGSPADVAVIIGEAGLQMKPVR